MSVTSVILVYVGLGLFMSAYVGIGRFRSCYVGLVFLGRFWSV
jgi:hypothetical protein